MADESDADARIGQGASALEQHVLRRIVKPDLLLKVDLARPLCGENLGCLLRARRARVNEGGLKKFELSA